MSAFPAPARPHLRERPRREHPHRHVRPVRVVEHQPRGRHRQGAARGGALEVDRIPWRPSSARPVELSVVLPLGVRRRELGGQRKQRVRVHPPRLGAGGRQGSFESPAEPSERGLRRRPRPAREAACQEHPAVLERERRSARVERAPAGMGEERPASRRHPRLHAARVMPGLGPVSDRRPVARARPVDDLHRGALRSGVGQRARQRFQRPVVDAREGRKLQQEAAAPGVQVEIAPLVPRAPWQQVHQRSRQGRQRPGLERVRSREQVPEPLDHRSLQRDGSTTVRTQCPSR